MPPALRAIMELTDYDFGIAAIDSGYGRPRLNAIHLIVEGDRAALVDTGVNSSVPRVLAALAAKGLAPEQVEYVFLTHVHLDHAGGAGELMRHLPRARLTVHPRGARHMADPSRLLAGTVAVYGEAATRKIYGTVIPVAPERIVETPEGTVLALGQREFRFIDTPGHARHHVAIVDGRSGHVFTGDTFGLSYRELDCGGRQFVIPTTSPVQFDPAAAIRSVERIAALAPPAIYVTHYSQVRDIPRLASDMRRLIEAHAALAHAARDAGAGRAERLRAGVERIVLEEARRQGWALRDDEILAVLGGDIELNAQGLACWLDAAA
jgi:hydroxyacylglutathione hydrolase